MKVTFIKYDNQLSQITSHNELSDIGKYTHHQIDQFIDNAKLGQFGEISIVNDIYLIENVIPGEIREFWFNYYERGLIKGIKVNGDLNVGTFKLSIFTDDTKTEYIYYSSIIDTILWDIMDIPFVDETGQNKIYIVLESLNDGQSGNFELIIYTQKGVL